MNDQKHRENGFQLIVVKYRKRGTRNYTNTLTFDTSNPVRMNALKDVLTFLSNNDFQFTCNNI